MGSIEGHRTACGELSETVCQSECGLQCVKLIIGLRVCCVFVAMAGAEGFASRVTSLPWGIWEAIIVSGRGDGKSS